LKTATRVTPLNQRFEHAWRLDSTEFNHEMMTMNEDATDSPQQLSSRLFIICAFNSGK
jgi:hypothetical protein